MLDGWYCRSMANMQANEEASVNSSSAVADTSQADSNKDYSSESSSDPEPEPNYRAQYLALKKKLKYLIYENECFQDALRSSQKRLLKVSRDRTFLLDRLLQYEKPDSSTSESEDTESSDDTSCTNTDTVKRKKMEANASQPALSTPSSMNKGLNSNIKRKRAVVPKKPTNANHPQGSTNSLAKASPALGFGLTASDGHMTPEEVERHLQSRQTYLKLLPERAPPTVPTEMFSNDPSLDSESNDVLENSPNVEEWFD
ncbi:INO80 complex subunit E [Colias croceus]|uniref:INO80 complex subunit E n=1 Tax=Colias crocea TaxID=72248 RepID=UPI001E27AD63|nr:INO80 complex subunit E [Colias croceus]XP_045498564.1 INO80 complex subunit E [Colias croceus]